MSQNYNEYRASAPTLKEKENILPQVDVNGNARVTEATLHAGEDLTNDVQKVEERYITSGIISASGAVKGSAGFIHAITIACNDAAPTAGNIDVYDNASAASGTRFFSTSLTTTWFPAYTIIVDAVASNGIYVNFTTTGDVNVFISYR